MTRTLAALAFLWAVPAAAAECRLVAEGRVALDGPCRFEPFGDGTGSFTIRAPDGAAFAYVLVTGEDVAEGWWNGGDPRSTHAHVPLGPLSRDGACWRGQGAAVCAWE